MDLEIELEEIYYNLRKLKDEEIRQENLKCEVMELCKKEYLLEEDKDRLNELFEDGFLYPGDNMNIYIFTACFYGCLCALQIFKNKGCNLNVRDDKALIIARDRGFVDLVDFLMCE